jgi:chemotaxis protein methyltransferase CheR
VTEDLMSVELSDAQFEEIRKMLYKMCGIDLHPGKEALVKARLTKRLRLLELSDFRSYMNYLESDDSGRELAEMIDSLTTNKTSFFRESQHFDYLCNVILPKLNPTRDGIRIWSAGCSSGEEPFTLGIALCEALPHIKDVDVRILATDISTRVLTKAREATYSYDVVRDLPMGILSKYFKPIPARPRPNYQVNQDVRDMVHFARLNLMGSWPMKGPFDAIFCRNVMIYFDKPTQQALIHRYWEKLKPGGHLFVGHSESLTASSHEYRYVQPAVYQR